MLTPERRQNTQQIPFRSIPYDHKGVYYNQRTVKIQCILTKKISKAQFREVAYWLSQKERLYFYDEPDKYYTATLYSSIDVTVFPNEVEREFTLLFVCEPFAYKDIPISIITTGSNTVHYRGTTESPCTIILKNNNHFAISNIQITALKRRK